VFLFFCGIVLGGAIVLFGLDFVFFPRSNSGVAPIILGERKQLGRPAFDRIIEGWSLPHSTRDLWQQAAFINNSSCEQCCVVWDRAGQSEPGASPPAGSRPVQGLRYDYSLCHK